MDDANLAAALIDALALGLVLAVGLYLVAVGLAALAKPAAASRFLSAFASSAKLHYLELGLRVVAGLAFVRHAPEMSAGGAFLALGWMLVLTSACLALLPWRWHRRFAERAVPQALRFLPVLGIMALALGGAVLLASG